MRIAIFHDYLKFIGGGEKAMLTLARGLGADIITTDVDLRLVEKMGFSDVNIISLKGTVKVPPFTQLHAAYKFGACDFTDHYDKYIMSGNWGVFACKKHKPNIWYCYTPVRAFYDLYDQFKAQAGLASPVFTLYASYHRKKYEDAVTHADRIITISSVTRDRVKTYLGQVPGIIFPPIDTTRFHHIEDGDFWLSVNRIYPEKRIEVQIEAFRQMPEEKLVIVGGYGKGDHSERYAEKIYRSLPSNVTIMCNISEDELCNIYGRCHGLISTPMDEDFGMNAVEAMAAGKPVIAVAEGGYLETVIDGQTGKLIECNPYAIISAVKGAGTRWNWSRSACENRSRLYDSSKFISDFKVAIKRL